MVVRCKLALLIGWLSFGWSAPSVANPYPDPRAVPRTSAAVWAAQAPLVRLSPSRLAADARPVLRVRLDWIESQDRFVLGDLVQESSGTDAVYARATTVDPYGSYEGRLVDPASGATIAIDTIGTGQHFRKLTRALTFRFPMPSAPVDLILRGEHPDGGQRITMLTQRIDPAIVEHSVPPRGEVEVRLLAEATAEPKLLVNVYAEGYAESRRARFFADAARVPAALREADFPGLARFEVRAVFRPSTLALGAAADLGEPVAERDSYLGLYFPYWEQFGRWYHVVYPTREERYRRALAEVPYDYAIALTDSSSYWGVGNFRELTAIPAANANFSYLLLHEIGHFFGLNEEYESGGPTELAFAPGIAEPWSQNITFLRDPAALKWRHLVAATTPVPTPSSRWSGSGPFGAYRGGYAETPPLATSHKPGLACIMGSGARFCPVCADAVLARVRFDAGLGGQGAD